MISFRGEKGELLIKAIIRKQGDPDFELIKTWFNAMLADTQRQLIYTEGDDTLRAQGYGECLTDLTKALNDPRAIIDNLEKDAARKRQMIVPKW